MYCAFAPPTSTLWAGAAALVPLFAPAQTAETDPNKYQKVNSKQKSSYKAYYRVILRILEIVAGKVRLFAELHTAAIAHTNHHGTGAEAKLHH